jgi:formate-dependent phosphoribosylglycinamide formyltransferase (GAR transformylase)
MSHVTFVAPFFLPNTLRFLRALAGLEGLRLSVVTQQALEGLPAEVRSQLAGHWRVDDALSARSIEGAVRGLEQKLGRPDRLLGVLEQIQEPVAAVRDALGIPGMGLETAHNFRDKARMKTLLREAGLPCARHRLAESRQAARDFTGEVGFPVVVKPPAGAGAKATFRVDDARQLESALESLAPAPARPWLLEEFLSGEEQSFDVVSVHGEPVWHSLTHYLPTPLQVLENPWIQWCVVLPLEVDDPRYDDARDVGFQALRVLGMGTGVSHMEWFRRPDGSVAVSEIAARPPGAQITTLMSYAHDFDFLAAWARLMVFDEFRPPERKYAAGAAFLRAQGHGRVQAIRGLDRAQEAAGDLVVKVELPRPGQGRADSYEGEGYVIVRHPETSRVLEALKEIISNVRVEVG